MPARGKRNVFYHNAAALHIKVIPEEMKKAAKLLAERLCGTGVFHENPQILMGRVKILF